MDVLDKKLNEIFSGKVVRKDLVHQIKKAANVPSFVLEFLLSKYCATDDPDEIKAGSKAVLEVVEKNFWENYLHVLKKPVPMDQRVIVFRGIDGDMVYSGADASKKFIFSTMLCFFCLAAN